MEDRSIGIEIKKIDSMITRKMFVNCKNKSDIHFSPIQISVLKYLFKNRQKRVFQKDLEQLLTLRRSTISGILKTMEKNNLIVRIDSSEDARSKEILLTDKARELAVKMKKNGQEFDNLLKRDIKDEDLLIFFKVTNQIKLNLMEDEIC